MQFSSQPPRPVQALKFIIASCATAVCATLAALSLKFLTEHGERFFFAAGSKTPALLFLLPMAGLSLIYLLRRYAFSGKSNEGIAEIFEVVGNPGRRLPSFKIPSHFVNGFVTVVSGGSTGIEVSTVVSSAAMGNMAQLRTTLSPQYKTALVCAGVAAGITALFGSPAAGLLFAMEVIARKFDRMIFCATAIAAALAWWIVVIVGDAPLFRFHIAGWHYHAIPYFVLLGLIAGLHTVYFTKTVLLVKAVAKKVSSAEFRVIAGAGLIGLAILFLPKLYGEGYPALREQLQLVAGHFTLSAAVLLLALVMLKPIVTAVTLSAGGDGGVFAPTLFTGALLGLLFSRGINGIWQVGIIPENFMAAGMAAALAAAINAPMTAFFLVCGLSGNFSIAVPLAITCLVSRWVAKSIFPYTVYSYGRRC